MDWTLTELGTWHILRPILTISFCLLCACATIYYRRKLTPFYPRLPSVSLLAISLSHEMFVMIPYMLNMPPGGSTSGWVLGLLACRFYTWTVLYLGQTLGITLVFITLHEWIQMHQAVVRARWKLGTVSHNFFALMPWLLAGMLTIRLKAFTGNLAYLDTGRDNNTACQLDVHSEQDIINLRTTNIMLNFLCPATLSFLALVQLWSIEWREFASRSKRFRGGCAVDRTSSAERWMASRSLPVVSFNLVHFILRAPHCLVMLLLVCQPMALSKNVQSIWGVVTCLNRAIYCVLPFLWLLLQPEVPRAFYLCTRAVRRKLAPTGQRYSDSDVLWSLTTETASTVSNYVPIYRDPNTRSTSY